MSSSGDKKHVAKILWPKKQVASTSPTNSPPLKRQLESIGSLASTFVRHVVFDFTLLNGSLARSPSDEEYEILGSLYPTQYGVGVIGVFLVINVTELPPQPWPLTVAGLPLYISTDLDDLPFLFGMFDLRSRKHVLQELDSKDFVTDKLYEAAIKWFDEESVVVISSIMWKGGIWQITIPDGSDTSILPRRLSRSTCAYLYESEMPKQTEAAFRLITPTTTIRDDAMYNILRAGIMASSGRFLGEGSVLPRSESYTTAGVLVKDKDGNEFMTVASHGFPPGEETVFHPNPNGTIIGEVKLRLGNTDLALVQLQDEVVFENTGFQSPTQPLGVEVKQVMPVDCALFGDILSMNNPSTGHIESVYMGERWNRIPSDSHDPKMLWVHESWLWYGQDAGRIPVAGSCESPICREDGMLDSFFRFMITNGPHTGNGYSISARELEKFGFEVVRR